MVRNSVRIWKPSTSPSVLVLASAGCCVAATALYSHTAFPNTSVLGMDVSGLSAQETEQRWTEQGLSLIHI